MGLFSVSGNRADFNAVSVLEEIKIMKLQPAYSNDLHDALMEKMVLLSGKFGAQNLSTKINRWTLRVIPMQI